MVTYIKKSAAKKFVVLDTELDALKYANQGSSLEEYEAGLWVKLSDEQSEYHRLHPDASVEEVWMMGDTDTATIRTIEEAKADLKKSIEMYDKSTAVNSFVVNGSMQSWLSVEERLNYKQSVEAARLLGEDTLDFMMDGVVFTVTVHAAELMLAHIQRYADKCFMVTALHHKAVDGLVTMEEIGNYDYRSGYPEKLKFEL